MQYESSRGWAWIFLRSCSNTIRNRVRGGHALAAYFFAIHDARENEDAVQLGIAALNDRSRVVRHRACSLLAYSLRDDALPYLRQLLMHHDPSTKEDARAAIDAIEHRNHNWFVDREHTGRLTWTVDKEVEGK